MASHFSVEFVFTFVCLIFIINAFIFLAFEKNISFQIKVYNLERFKMEMILFVLVMILLVLLFVVLFRQYKSPKIEEKARKVLAISCSLNP